MSLLLMNVLLALAWSALMGNFDPPYLVFGFVLGYLILWLFYQKSPTPKYFREVPLVIEFVIFFLWEIILSNIRLTMTILSPQMKLRPAVVAVPLDLKSDIGIVMLSHMITLTPGTLSLDISSNRHTLYVHVYDLDDPDKFIDRIKSKFERRVREIIE
ncbi:MAG TPA: Na+/H+ antiporter subunit E [Anaerolineaceae bacterium]|nr:Na+/H+ antiporter subunit E [Anaerolineaceae bacterium]